MQIFDIKTANTAAINNIAPQQTQKPLFKAGERMEASVVSVDGRSVKLALSDGSTLDAARSANEVMRPGDTVTLEVNSSTASSANLKLIEVNGQPVMPEISGAQARLMRVSYAPTQDAAANLTTLTKLELPVSASALTRMAEIKHSAPTLNLERAALLASTDIPLTNANIKAFDAWLSSPVSASALANSLNELALTDPKAAKAVLDAFSASTATQSAASGQSQGAQAAITPNANTAANATTANIPKADVQTINPQTGGNTQGAAIQSGAQETSAALQGTTAQAQVNIPEQSVAQGAQQGIAPQGILADNTAQATIPLQGEVRQGYTDAVKASHGELPSSPPLKRVLAELFLKLSDADNAVNARGEAIKEAVTRLPESVARLSNALGEAATRSQAAQPSLSATNQLAGQLSMGAELGSMLYTQIPLRNDENHATADLYILKRDKGAKKIDDANATVAICLETENLGRVESLVHIEKNDLSVRFRVQSEREAKFIKARLSDLRALDFPAQYKLRTVSVVLADEPLSLSNAARTMQKEFNMPSSARGLDIQV